MSRPNLLMIVLDQLRYDCLGRSSGGRVSTPVIDALAASGAWFDNAFCHLPTCCPARQSLLTGQRPETLGALWNFDIALPIPSLAPDIPTWPVQLRDVGYRTGYVGKWHGSADHDPTEFGYQRYVSVADHNAHVAARHGRQTYANGWFGEVSPLPAEDLAPHWLAGQAAEQVREFAAGDGPWHVRLDLEQPHLPCRPAAEYAERYPADAVEPWPNFAEDFAGKPHIQRQQLHSWGVADWTWEQWAPVVARYLAVINQVDDAIGELLGALDATGQRDNTIVVFTTDHGDLCGAHRMMDKHYVLYDDVTHVPLIISGPGIAAGQVRGEFVYNLLDCAPTLADLLDLPGLPDPAGRSLAPLLGAATPPADWRDDVVLTYNGQQFGLYTERAIRTHDWKYIWNATDVDELYDLNADPHELTNRIGDSSLAPLVTELRRRLHAQLSAAGDRQVTNDWVRRQLLDDAIV
jgi:arylsulfatase A-like enzyme